MAAGGGLFAYGMILTLIADNYVRPALIVVQSNCFIWTLLEFSVVWRPSVYWACFWGLP